MRGQATRATVQAFRFDDGLRIGERGVGRHHQARALGPMRGGTHGLRSFRELRRMVKEDHPGEWRAVLADVTKKEAQRIREIRAAEAEGREVKVETLAEHFSDEEE